MKTYKLSLIIFLSAISLFSNAQENNNLKKKEITFKVAGKCDMCKARIEEALDIKGVKFAEWDLTTHLCNVVYNPQKISEQEIHQTLAKIGHDTEKIKAKEEDYKSLHSCCNYNRLEYNSPNK